MRIGGFEYLYDQFFVLQQQIPIIGSYFINEKIHRFANVCFYFKSPAYGFFFKVLEFQFSVSAFFYTQFGFIPDNDYLTFAMF